MSGMIPLQYTVPSRKRQPRPNTILKPDLVSGSGVAVIVCFVSPPVGNILFLHVRGPDSLSGWVARDRCQCARVFLTSKRIVAVKPTRTKSCFRGGFLFTSYLDALGIYCLTWCFWCFSLLLPSAPCRYQTLLSHPVIEPRKLGGIVTCCTTPHPIDINNKTLIPETRPQVFQIRF